MNGLDAVGRGAHTPLKQAHLGLFLRQYVATWKAIVARRSYYDRRLFLFDITAGCGVHPETLEPGSPLIILNTVDRAGIQYRAFFIEEALDNFMDLTAVLAEHHPACAPYVEMECGDHKDVLPRLILQHLRPQPRPLGLIYYDFARTNIDASLRLLVDLYRSAPYALRLPAVDCLMYLPATTFKRVRGVLTDRPRLADYLDMIGKKHWLVREPAGANQYTFLIGTNWMDMNGRKSMGLFSIYSMRGKEIFAKLNFTAEELE